MFVICVAEFPPASVALNETEYIEPFTSAVKAVVHEFVSEVSNRFVCTPVVSAIPCKEHE